VKGVKIKAIRIKKAVGRLSYASGTSKLTNQLPDERQDSDKVPALQHLHGKLSVLWNPKVHHRYHKISQKFIDGECGWDM
jgi:hypothetical protein